MIQCSVCPSMDRSCWILCLSSLNYLLVFAAASSPDSLQHAMQKRQIFREQVLPHTGGKIPEEAFRTDRLALNRLNKEGIAIPDGVLLETRHRESHFPFHRQDPDINASIIRLVQRPDGRYAPPEGRYPFNQLVESTYVIRAPISAGGHQVPPTKPIETPLRLPSTQLLFDHSEDVLDINHLENSDLFDTLNSDFPGSKLWTGFGPLFHETANRILRHSGKGRKNFQPPSNQLNPRHQSASSAKPFASKPAGFVQLTTASSRPAHNSPTKTFTQFPSMRTTQLPVPSRYSQQPRSSVQRVYNKQPQQQGFIPYTKIPKTSFACKSSGRTMEPDPSTGCQVFHLCHSDGRKESFLCPHGTRYDKKSNLCSPWRNVPC